MITKRILSIGLLVVFLLYSPHRAHADFAAGVAAYDQGDYATALQEFLPLAQQGDIKAQYNMGILYEKWWSRDGDIYGLEVGCQSRASCWANSSCSEDIMLAT